MKNYGRPAAVVRPAYRSGRLGPRGRSWTLPVGETTGNKEADWGIEDRHRGGKDADTDRGGDTGKNGGERARAPTHHPANRTPSGTIRRGRAKCGRQGSALPPPRGGHGHRQRRRRPEVPCSHSQKQTNRHTGAGVRGTRGKGGSAEIGDMRRAAARRRGAREGA